MDRLTRNRLHTRIRQLATAVDHKILPAHYYGLLTTIKNKAIDQATSLGLNPKAITSLVRDIDGGYLSMPSLLYALVPDVDSWSMTSERNLKILSDWVGLPYPEVPHLTSVDLACSDLDKLRPYSDERIVTAFPSLRILFPRVEFTNGRAIHRSIPHLLALCTTAASLGLKHSDF